MRLLVLFGLVAANPVTDPYIFCRVISNTSHVNKQTFYDQAFPALTTLCGTVDIEINRAKLEEKTWWDVNTPTSVEYDECFKARTSPVDEVRRQCTEWQ